MQPINRGRNIEAQRYRKGGPSTGILTRSRRVDRSRIVLGRCWHLSQAAESIDCISEIRFMETNLESRVKVSANSYIYAIVAAHYIGRWDGKRSSRHHRKPGPDHCEYRPMFRNYLDREYGCKVGVWSKQDINTTGSDVNERGLNVRIILVVAGVSNYRGEPSAERQVAFGNSAEGSHSAS